MRRFLAWQIGSDGPKGHDPGLSSSNVTSITAGLYCSLEPKRPVLDVGSPGARPLLRRLERTWSFHAQVVSGEPGELGAVWDEAKVISEFIGWLRAARIFGPAAGGELPVVGWGSNDFDAPLLRARMDALGFDALDLLCESDPDRHAFAVPAAGPCETPLTGVDVASGPRRWPGLVPTGAVANPRFLAGLTGVASPQPSTQLFEGIDQVAQVWTYESAASGPLFDLPSFGRCV